MQQLTYVKPNCLEWREVPRPVLQSDRSVLVRPLAVARCDLDRYIALGQYRAPGPFALGHEMAGEIVEVGDRVKGFSPGEKVIVPFQINCGECGNCRRGWTNACEQVPPCAAYGLGTHPHGEFGGGLSDLVLVPFGDAMLVKLPPALSPAAACGLSDNVADGYRTVAPLLRRFPGEAVLVAGGLAQSVGLYAVQAALACGAEKVVYVDSDPVRLAHARELGAVVETVDYVREERFETPFLITVEAACTPAGMAYALRSTAPCGFCTSVSGGLTPTTALPLSSIYLNGITYQISRVHARATLPQVLDQACCGRLDPLRIVDRQLSFADAIDGFFDPSPKLVFLRD